MMVATGPYVRAFFDGTFDGVQGWSHGVSLAQIGGSPLTAADLNGFCTAAATAYNSFFSTTATGLKAFLDTQARWTQTRALFYPAGSLVSTASGINIGAAVPGTNGTAAPRQLSLVVSHHTALAGRRNRGRAYLPYGIDFDSTGRASATAVNSLAAGYQLLLQQLNTITVAGSSFACVVGTGDLPHIVSISIDNVVDTQRRRRDKITPTLTATKAI